MMTDLDPVKIYESYQEGHLTLEETIEQLISVIEAQKDTWERYQAIDFLAQLESIPYEFFNFFSDLLVFEATESIRDRTLEILIKNFPEQAVSRIKWFLEQHPEERYKTLVSKLLEDYYDPDLASLSDLLK